MDELAQWINDNFKGTQKVDKVEIMTPQFERTEPLEYDWKPTNDKEFEHVIHYAPPKVLLGMGFRRWDTMNNIIEENNNKPESRLISIPIVNTGDTYEVDLGRKSTIPTEPLDPDEDIWLIPGEWYDLIPEGFELTDIFGEAEIFKHGESDDDIRGGVLPFGFRRPVEEKERDEF